VLRHFQRVFLFCLYQNNGGYWVYLAQILLVDMCRIFTLVVLFVDFPFIHRLCACFLHVFVSFCAAVVVVLCSIGFISRRWFRLVESPAGMVMLLVNRSQRVLGDTRRVFLRLSGLGGATRSGFGRITFRGSEYPALRRGLMLRAP